MRVGLLAKKIGMTRAFDEFGNHHPLTVVECPEAVVTNVGQNTKNNVKLASFETKKKSLNKAQTALYEKLKTPYRKHSIEFTVEDASQFKAGQIVTLNHFVEGQLVDVRGRTSGKGFAGGMKRHGFGGLEATHGVSISHRSHGSTGQCQDPGRVFKGKKMAGHMGDTNVTVQNLEIYKIDSENSLIYIRGAIPGKKGVVVRLTDAVKTALPLDAPYPAFFKGDKAEKAADAAEAKQEQEAAEQAPVENKAEEAKVETAEPAKEAAPADNAAQDKNEEK